jgi:Spy/CpxP family protein refolding chaperone
MSMGKWVMIGALVLGGGSMLIAAEEPATTQPAEAKPAHAARLTQPWSRLKSLTPEQTAQIEKIHADALEQIKKIDAKEHDDIMALLTPDQVTELKAAEDKLKADRKEKMAERKKATTQAAE